MTTTVTVSYESGPKFDIDYYVTKHFAIVEEKWGPLGLLSWEVLQFDEGQQYQVQAILRWKSTEAFEAASANPVTQEVIADVANFTTAKPIFIKGKSAGASSAKL
ncbi:hypothetical protein SAPIO_CDS1840 [Scedosporium apiospermum]|uniref:Ethyl tert-butyl ether degradation EthD n=1 Tax=Pseudallescheria apiosperma TaxID=563466 RepID=A0A084GDV4_PSEDA|nr:uncharacterized protein SAPIO_CDS1840 [Scedosporium apiospermum]KEZ45516.1 hypothetical protein SAPIO_CDS1840 [Scedosporium apiospermum]